MITSMSGRITVTNLTLLDSNVLNRASLSSCFVVTEDLIVNVPASNNALKSSVSMDDFFKKYFTELSNYLPKI